MRCRGIAVAAAVVLGLIGIAPSAQADDRIDLPVPADAAQGYYQILDIAVTGGAVYVATLQFVTGADPGLTLVWRYALHPHDGGTALGNAQLIGTVRQPGGIAADDDAVLWADGVSNQLALHRDDGATTLVSGPSEPPVTSFSGSWFISGELLWPFPPDRPGAEIGILTGRADDWDTLPPNLTPVDWPVSATSDTAVAWREMYRELGTYVWGTRLYANALNFDGFVGEPVMLDENLDTLGGGFTPMAGPEVSDTTVAWIAWDVVTDERVVRWVPTSDLTAPPQELPIDWVVGVGFAIDDDHIAFSGIDNSLADSEGAVVVVDLSTGEVRFPGHGSVNRVELHGDLVAWTDPADGHQFLHLSSISGETDLSAAPSFTDVTPVNPFLPYIDQIAIAGITTGYPDGTFRPTAPVTREAMAAFLYRQAGSPDFTPPAESPFTDVWTTHPFYKEISWLADQGISTGWAMSDGTAQFRPGQPVTREATAAFLYRLAGSPAFAFPHPSPFTDVTAGDTFATQIAWAASTGITTGWHMSDGTYQFRPAQPITREAMAAFLSRYDNLEA